MDFGGRKAQCRSHFAPWAIHVRIWAISSGETVSFEARGGMTSSGSLWVRRCMTSLSSGFPGTMAVTPLLKAFLAFSSRARRRSALRGAAPWGTSSSRTGRSSGAALLTCLYVFGCGPTRWRAHRDRARRAREPAVRRIPGVPPCLPRQNHAFSLHYSAVARRHRHRHRHRRRHHCLACRRSGLARRVAPPHRRTGAPSHRRTAPSHRRHRRQGKHQARHRRDRKTSTRLLSS